MATDDLSIMICLYKCTHRLFTLVQATIDSKLIPTYPGEQLIVILNLILLSH